MKRAQRAKSDMFVRARHFGDTNTDVFPRESSAGKTFGQLAAVVTSIEDQLVRRADARADARKVKVATRRAVVNQMKAIAATGRVAAIDETGTHPFRLPVRRLPVDVLSTARLFREEAERRQEKFVELGMAPAFLTDFDATIAALADARRASRSRARRFNDDDAGASGRLRSIASSGSLPFGA